MILKNVFGKTIEAAKKSAQQMYGDDFLVMESNEGDASGSASITIFSDGKKKEQEKLPPEQQNAKGKTAHGDQESGVLFERSYDPGNNSDVAKPNMKKEDRLSSLRKFALELDKELKEPTGENSVSPTPMDEINGLHSNGNGTKAYGRAAIRNPLNGNGSQEQSFRGPDSEDSDSKPPVNDTRTGNGFITHFKQSEHSREKQRQRLIVSPNRNEEREIKALHKRFDKLEALLDSALISANLDYASHPAFQQLVHTGISTSTIAGWFSKVIEKGIDPYDQPEQFMIKLGGIIRNALGEPNLEAPQKYMLFVGPSGSGKTSLIMKLSQHPELMDSKKIAVVSVHPQDQKSFPYYTILKPFCDDHDLPYFEVRNGKDVNDHLELWSDYDHVLIDTPSINIEQENSFRMFWKIRQMLTPLTPLEIHYVVNASLNKFYFKNTSATHHPLHPDHVAITHLDEVSQWGPVLPFLQEMSCTARYISKGENSPNSLDEFDPRWFAQRILQEN